MTTSKTTTVLKLLATTQLLILWGCLGVKALRSRVVVISLDGFPHEQLSRHSWEHITWIYAHGSQPRRFINQFPTKSFPNHFCVATGVFQEVHGVVGNTVYDPVLNLNLTIHDSEFFKQNPGVMPLWTLNELHGGHSGCIMWPGCNFPYHEKNVTFWKPYQPDQSFSEIVDVTVKWLTHSLTPANLVFLYHDQPDMAGHLYGPNSPYYSEALTKVDKGLGYLFRVLDLHGLRQEVDVLIMSDHGMAPVSSVTNIIDLNDVVDSQLYSFSGSSPVLNIWPVKDKDVYVYEKLQKGSSSHHYRVFLKENSQMKAWHYSDNPRISKFTVVADPGYVFQDFREYIKNFHDNGYPGLTDMFGDHGYVVDDPSMEPIFVAVGPSFRQKFTSENFSNIDVYPLVCLLLGLPPGPNNGTLETISTILSSPVSLHVMQPLIIALVFLVVLGMAIMVVMCALQQRNRHQPISADTLISGYVYRKTIQKDKNKHGEGTLEEECLLENEDMEIV